MNLDKWTNPRDKLSDFINLSIEIGSFRTYY